MRPTRSSLVWVGRGARVWLAIVGVAGALPAVAADANVLFPTPLHIVRRVDEPITRTSTVVDQYCAGNRVVTVSGDRVAISDYDKQQLTEIDRAAGTYSITPFAELANAQAAVRATAAETKWEARPVAAKSSLETYELTSDGTTIEVSVDRRVPLSRDALDVLIGAAYPNARRPEHDAIVRAAGGLREAGLRQSANTAATQSSEYALPSEETITYEAEGERLVTHTAVVRVTSELPSTDLITIPPGAQLVESHTTRAARELRQLDQLPPRQH